mgnify:CR=1 FL=1
MDFPLVLFIIAIVFILGVLLGLQSVKLLDKPIKEEVKEEPVPAEYIGFYDRRYQSIMAFPKASKVFDRMKIKE